MSAIWAAVARLQVWGELGFDLTTEVILTAAVLLIAVVVAVIVDPWRGHK